MPNVINPPALSTLIAGWWRGGIAVELSFGVMWLLSQVMGGFFRLSVLFFAVAAVGWTAIVLLGCAFEHTVTIADDELVVRTWGGALLGRGGQRFPLQTPRLTRGRMAGRGGAGLRGTRMSLVDSAGRQHYFAFILIRPDRLVAQIDRVSPQLRGHEQPAATGGTYVSRNRLIAVVVAVPGAFLVAILAAGAFGLTSGPIGPAAAAQQAIKYACDTRGLYNVQWDSRALASFQSEGLCPTTGQLPPETRLVVLKTTTASNTAEVEANMFVAGREIAGVHISLFRTGTWHISDWEWPS